VPLSLLAKASLILQQTSSSTLVSFPISTGTILSGTEAYSVDLRTSLAFTNPFGLTKNLDFDFNLSKTPNTGSATQNADSVSLSSPLPTTIFTIDGVDYSLKMGFGSLKRGLFSQVNEFTVVEGGKASAKLVGIITASKPQSVPDSGSTLALMAMAIVGVGGVRQFLARKTA
jgi:VPDSG-CTERM motif